MTLYLAVSAPTPSRRDGAITVYRRRGGHHFNYDKLEGCQLGPNLGSHYNGTVLVVIKSSKLQTSYYLLINFIRIRLPALLLHRHHHHSRRYRCRPSSMQPSPFEP